MSYKVVRIAWKTEVMPVPAFDYFHQDCLLKQPEFKSEAIASGTWTVLDAEQVSASTACSTCSEKLREA